MTVINLKNEPQEKKQVDEEGYFTPYNVGMKETSEKEVERLVYATSSLPQNLRSILVGFDSAVYIEENLGPAFGLTLNQKKEIAKVIRDVVLADLFIGDMVSRLSVEGGMEQNKAREVANHVVNNLFKPVLEDLKNIQRERFGNAASEFKGEINESKPEQNTAPSSVYEPKGIPSPKPLPNTPPETNRPSLSPNISNNKPAPTEKHGAIPNTPKHVYSPINQDPSSPTIGLKEIQESAKKVQNQPTPGINQNMPGGFQNKEDLPKISDKKLGGQEPKKYNVVDLKSL
ncbi:MAG: hypothetical protein COV29_04530 [Candidatus Yanofskybacteria bacterium CG10_big_fil_rev_8_21_14_0_10_36_16]|uniref:Uncharacterized protein n=1 Tax=Candidatus Yanofskybacteria bacterium CG10_big_fil_rev_8_21_14_0_10_36_16 TaxID=1975096 RepID=A0A2J0Q6U6_9BACT|nr:MAG: hypothetical protein COV29_04530 [Candidatus Yanofskybacteria bacterium CG10_big_fil_rev_8_21_14_0_10_36_16]